MSKMVFEVRESSDTFVNTRLSSLHHNGSGRPSAAEIAIGGVVLAVLVCFVMFVVIG